jgi:RNA-directed DNA polymerase
MRAHQQEFKFHNGDLLEEICEIHNLYAAFKLVKRNKGAPGIDGVTIEVFEQNLDQELIQIREEVLNWMYKPTPVKRVEIPKPNGKGVRMLGIPIIKDRILHMAIKRVLEPLFDPFFSAHSYGFRPERNQRQAVEAAQQIVQSGKEYVVDIDLSKFFDRINHDRLIHRLGQQVKDKRVLRLIGMILRSGIMDKEGLSTPTEGSVQGSPLSPLLSNVVLDELDKELERRGLEFCRYADDCNIFVKTERAANRIMQSVKKFIESKLKLKVNEEKSKVAKSNRVKFLGMTIVNGLIAISKAAFNKAMEKVKSLIPRGSHLPIESAIDQFNSWFRGWGTYFNMTQFPAQLKAIEAHARRRFRARLVKQHKRRRFLFRKLIRTGITKSLAVVVYKSQGPWRLSHTRAIERGYPNRWFEEHLGLLILSDQKLEHWQPVTEWVKLT